MADPKRELQDALDQFVKDRVNLIVIPARVSTVDFTAQTVDVTDLDGVVIHDVRLKAAVDSQSRGVVIFPAEGSQVLIAAIGNNPNEYTVIHVAQIHSVKMWIGTLTIEADTTGVKMTKGGEDFKTLLSDLLDAVIIMTMPVSGATAGPPANAATFTTLKARLSTLFS